MNSVTEGALVVSLTPELHLVGDFVTRSMFRRIEVWRDCLTEYRKIVYHAVEAARRCSESLLKAENEAWTSLGAADAALRKACLTGKSAELRDACIVLTQTYAAFHPNPELAWLKLPQHIIAQGTSLFRRAVESGRSLEAVDQIAAALRALRDVQETGGNSLENAIQTGGLVLVRKPPAAYWEKKEIDGGWDKKAKPFLLLWMAAENASLLGGAVRDEDFWDRPGAKSRLAQLKGRLLKVLRKTSLSKRIVYVRNQGVRLTLDRHRIHLLETPKG